MNLSLIRNLSLLARNLLVRSPFSAQIAASAAASASYSCNFSHYSTELDSTDQPSLDSSPAAAGVDDVTEEELNSRIQKFYQGDVEAIPSILEAILKRKLAGKNDEDLIEQLPSVTNRGNEETESDDEEDID